MVVWIQAYQQLSVCVLRAWRQLPSRGEKSSELSEVVQGPEELHADLVAHLFKVFGHMVADHEAGGLLVKQLAFENANSLCKDAIHPPRKTASITDYICLCADIGPAGVMAAASKTATARPVSQSPVGFHCHQPGHFKCACPVGTALQRPRATSMTPPAQAAPGICPHCQRGWHWANECGSKTAVTGIPLERSGNGGQGQP